MHNTEIIINQNYPGFNPVQFGYENCSAGHFYGPAVRTYYLLHYVVAGCGIFERAGETHRVEPGSIFVIPPYEETYYEADTSDPWRYIWIGFTCGKEWAELFSESVLRCPGAGAIFEDMKRCHGMENGRSAFLAAKIWELISLWQDQHYDEIGYVDKALHFIRSEYMNDITVQKIADRLNLNRSYFSTLFCRQTGIPPAQYLMDLRMEKAAELMLKHGERPSTAGISVGYPDLYQFSKVFKKHFGLSPREYIKKFKK